MEDSVVKTTTKKKCAICRRTSDNGDDCLIYGDWMNKYKITVHYFCLLTSTHLPQNGIDCNGILGFLLKDIRKEIEAAQERTCVFCSLPHASVRCNVCKEYFHFYCNVKNGGVSEFQHRFLSYCVDCRKLDDLQRKWLKCPPPEWHKPCYICHKEMGFYSPATSIYAPCCGNGFVHHNCMQQYALSAGYYLLCIWCRKSDFRDLVRMQGVFVPDRDAQWERQKDAYRELHRGHRRCDQEQCFCKRGRDYAGGKWVLINCSLCGSVGTHNPYCIPGHEKSKEKIDIYKCGICSVAENQLTRNNLCRTAAHDELLEEADFETTLYQNKESDDEQSEPMPQVPTFSDEDSVSSKESSVLTVVPHHSVVATASVIPPSYSLLLPPSPLKVSEDQKTKLPPTVTLDTPELYCTVIDLCSQTQDMDLAETFVESELADKSAATATKNAADGSGISAPAATAMEDIAPSTSATKVTTLQKPFAVEEGEPNTKQKLNSSPEVADEKRVEEDETEDLLKCSYHLSTILKESDVDTVYNFEDVEIDGNFATFWMFDFEEGHEMHCVGQSKRRIDLSSPRFAGKSMTDILSTDEHFTEEDIIERSDDIGVFEEIDRIIDEYRE